MAKGLPNDCSVALPKKHVQPKQSWKSTMLLVTSAFNQSYIACTLQEVTSPDSGFWQPLTSSSSKLPRNTQKDFMSACLMKKRAEEDYIFLATRCRGCYYTAGSVKLQLVKFKILLQTLKNSIPKGWHLYFYRCSKVLNYTN